MTSIDRDFHIHTELSCCAERGTTVSGLLDACGALGLTAVGISDHFHELDRDFSQMASVNRALVEQERPRRPHLQIFLGCEAQMNSPTQCTIDAALARQFDYVLCSCNHYHLTENPQDKSPAGYAAHYLQMVEGAIDTGFVDGITHPFLHEKLGQGVDRHAVLAAYDPAELDRILRKAGERGVALELNPDHAARAPEFFRGLIARGRSYGVKVELGSDAHAVRHLGYRRRGGQTYSFEDLETIFGLRREDLFMPGMRSSRLT